MSRTVYLAAFAALFASPLAMADESSTIADFSGSNNGMTTAFETTGPWLLDWQALSDQPWLATFELRLLDGETNEYLGSAVDVQGVGNGLRLFERAGRYRIGIVGREVDWTLEIAAVTEDQAAEMRRLSAGRPSLEDAARATKRTVPEGGFDSWRAEGSSGLLLFGDDGAGFRVQFMAPCSGLDTATAISFVTASRGRLNDFDSILLDDGTRCYFESVIPTLMD